MKASNPDEPDEIIRKRITSELIESELDLVKLIETLRQVNIDDPLAELNKTSISDNNGSRIIL